ncbi:hypothetical protein [Pedobacter nutrimenti]|uniref:Uncharacterized protein n=1 Tax=Pedobacter nutrimenti TaxID=1241337 RepID=A0A318UKZ5_9SPHI|nr:hypothetical protein [Pedobacter nutrimenti]PYF77044.1 hypothetical protein B0O44_101522 [Pedobacter nutrimenti]
MNKVSSLLSFSVCTALIFSLVCCSKHNSDTQGKRIKEVAKIDIGIVLPEIRNRRNDTVDLALYPNARVFFIDLGLRDSDHYLDLIRRASQANMPVRAKVFEDNTSEVAEISTPSAQDMETYKKHWVKPE